MEHCTEDEFYDCLEHEGMFRVTNMFEGTESQFEDCFGGPVTYDIVVDFANDYEEVVEVV